MSPCSVDRREKLRSCGHDLEACTITYLTTLPLSLQHRSCSISTLQWGFLRVLAAEPHVTMYQDNRVCLILTSATWQPNLTGQLLALKLTVRLKVSRIGKKRWRTCSPHLEEKNPGMGVCPCDHEHSAPSILHLYFTACFIVVYVLNYAIFCHMAISRQVRKEPHRNMAGAWPVGVLVKPSLDLSSLHHSIARILC